MNNSVSSREINSFKVWFRRKPAQAPVSHSADILFFSAEARRLAERMPARPYTADGFGPGIPPHPNEGDVGSQEAPRPGNGKTHPFETDEPVSVAVEMVRFVKAGGPLTKEISLGADGKLESDGSQCRMWEGVQERLPLKDWRDFAGLLHETPRNVAYGLGRLNEEFGDSVTIKKLGADGEGEARCKDTISYRADEPALVLLDFDTKGMPDAVKARLAALGGFHGALDHICAELLQAGYICRKSTSSGVYDAETGKEYEKSGEHIYLLVRDGTDAKRLLDTLHARAWANGLGWHIVSKNGAYLSRSIIDRSVSDASRLIFEAPPDLQSPLKQNRPKPLVHDGAPFDSRKYCLDLTVAESKACADVIAVSKARLKPEADKARQRFEGEKVAEAIKRGVDPETAKRMAQQWAKGVLLPDAVLDFRRHKLGFVTVADILACPENYVEKYIPDPLDGDDLHYSSAAKVRRREDGTVYVVSFAHGLVTEYNLRSDDCLDDQAIRARINELHRQTERLDTLSADYAEIKDVAIKLFAKSSDNYRGDPKERRYFYTQWKMDAKTLDKRLRQEDDTRRREQEARRGGNPDDQRVAELNKDYCFVIEGGKATVYHECYDPVLKRHFLAPLGPRDFQYAFENERVIVNTVNGPSEIGFGAFWLRHRERRQYLDGVVFDPANRHKDTQLNLWKGFGVTPIKGSWRRMKRHIFRIICGGNKKAFKYAMRWLANAVQHPERQGEVVIVMRGGEGVGKGFLARAMVRLFGRHGLHIENPKHLTGNFNAHLHGCVMLFADEAFYAGDKAHTGILKGLITEPMIVIEKKGKDVYQSGNFIHLMMASNHDWVVPASLDARRFCVLDVLDIHKDNHEYFEAIQNELDNGGYEAMLYDLQRVNLADFNVRKFPKTKALQDQKILSMKVEQKWLYRVLCQGYVRTSDFGLVELEQWHETVTTQYLHNAYERFAKECGERKPLEPVQFGKFMHDMGWSDEYKTQARTAFAGENLKRGRGEEPELRKNKERRPAYRLGTLADARGRFAMATGLDLTWPDEGSSAEETVEEAKERARMEAQEKARAKAAREAQEKGPF